MRKQMNMINIVPVFVGSEDFTVSEIIRQHKETGLTRFALCLSYHPQGTPARNLIPILCGTFTVIRDALKDYPQIDLGALIQSTQGHGWNGKVPLTYEPWQQIINLNGSISPRMCFLTEGFRAYIAEAIEETVRAGANFLLIDDDFGMRHMECFCPQHMAEYNKALGKNYSLEDFQEILQNRPYNDPEAQTIIKTRYEGILSFARLIRQAVDKVNPDVTCGFCTPWLGYGFAGEVTRILAGKTEPFARINNAIYLSADPTVFYYITAKTNRVKYHYEVAGVHNFIAESDTFPQNYYSESARHFHSHISNGIVNGLSGSKLWTSEFNNPVDISSQQHYEYYLDKYRNFYNELLNTVQNIQWQGVSAPLFVSPLKDHPFLVADWWVDWCHVILGPFAFPIHYQEPGKKGIYALAAKDAELMSDEDLKKLLASPVLIDSLAAKELTRRGFAELMGVNADDGGSDFVFSMEYHAESNMKCGYMWEERSACLTPLSDDVKVLTTVCSGASRGKDFNVVAPGMTYYENKLGGRVVVTAWTPELPSHLTMRPIRREWLKIALDHLSDRGVFEMSVENAQHQVLVRYGVLEDSKELLYALNLTADPLTCLDLRLARTPAAAEKLLADGTWEKVETRRISPDIVRVECPAELAMPVVIRFSFDR